jgi:3'(2'), 5'-bisphosphate nucleotidase
MMSRTTSATVPLLLRIVSETTSIVDVAGKIVRKVLQTGNLEVVDKGINDLQTRADRAAQQYIISELSSQFPKASIIGEEPDGGPKENLEEFSSILKCLESPFPDIIKQTVPDSISSISEDEIVIWVDPLDGTQEFTQGFLENVTVLVGIAVNGTPVGGVIHQPFVAKNDDKGRTMWGIPGVGFGGFEYKNPPEGKRIITTTRSHSNARVEAALAALTPTEILRIGGAGHKATLLMEGKAHAYVYASPGCKKWDTCAPEAVLRAVGGILTDLQGKPYSYNKDVEHLNAGGLLATAPGQDHEWYVKNIPPEN